MSDSLLPRASAFVSGARIPFVRGSAAVLFTEGERALLGPSAPSEWLFALLADSRGHQKLLDESGSLAVAAYRLAWARCCSAGHCAGSVPSASELRCAAREIARRTSEPCVPSTASLVRECEARGLPVI